jgi:DnaJ-domain-containing protein 1
MMKLRLLQMRYYFKHWKDASNSSYRGINLKKNYYRTLLVSSGASYNDIKKSYFKLAKELHPDVNPSGHAQFT